MDAVVAGGYVVGWLVGGGVGLVARLGWAR